MSINPIVLSIPIFFALIVIEWVVDIVSKKGYYNFNDVVGNIGCGITEQVIALFFKVLLIAIYTFIYNHFRLWDVPHTWYWAATLFIATDFFYYWAHRKSHEINLFWVGHVVHHQSENYNLSVALRQGTFQKLFTAPFFWPLAILGFDPLWFLMAAAFVTLYQFWIHTQYIDKMGWFEYIFNTPSHHRVHHGRDEKYLDKNHAGTFIIWDRMFGTFQEEQETPHFGITTQLTTFNPIIATVIPFKELATKVAESPGFANKIKSVFYGPGWSPIQRTNTTKIENKFLVNLSKNEIIYLSVLLVEIIAFAAALLFMYKSFSTQTLSLLASILIFTIWSAGNLVDKKPNAKWIETSRVLGFSLFIFQLDKYTGFGQWSIAVIFTSLLLLWLLFKKDVTKPN